MNTNNTFTLILSGTVVVLIGIIAYMGYMQFSQDDVLVQNGNEEELPTRFDIDLLRDELALDTLVPGSYVTSPLEFSGLAAPSWYTEGTFMVTLTDEDGTVIGETEAYADGGENAEGFIAFRGSLTFTEPEGTVGMLTFEKSVPEDDLTGGYSHGISVIFEEEVFEADDEEVPPPPPTDDAEVIDGTE